MENPKFTPISCDNWFSSHQCCLRNFHRQHWWLENQLSQLFGVKFWVFYWFDLVWHCTNKLRYVLKNMFTFSLIDKNPLKFVEQKHSLLLFPLFFLPPMFPSWSYLISTLYLNSKALLIYFCGVANLTFMYLLRSLYGYYLVKYSRC